MKNLILILVLFLAISENSAFGQNIKKGRSQSSKGTSFSDIIGGKYKRISSSSHLPHNKKAQVSPSILEITTCLTDTLLFENFESKTIPATWANLDLDANTDANALPQNWFIDYYLEPGQTNPDTSWVATSSSWFTNGGKSDNWLILNPVSICSDQVHLQWKSAPRSAYSYMDGYKILVSTTDNNPASFTDTIAVFAEDIDGSGNFFSDGTIHPEKHIYNGMGILHEWHVTLQQYAGQQIYIAFVHDSEDDDLLYLDDILIGEMGYDLAVENLRPVNGYSVIPSVHVSQTDFLAYVSNNSFTTSSGASLNFEINKNAVSVYSNSYLVPTLTEYAKDTLLMPVTYIPSETGEYIVTASISGLETDSRPSNNSFSRSVVISDSIFAKDNGIAKDFIYVGSEISGVIGQVFDLPVADSLSSITFHIVNPVEGDTIFGEIYDFSGNTPFPVTPIAYTDTLIITNTAIHDYTLSLSGGKKRVEPGKVLIGLREAKTSLLRLGIAQEYPNSQGYALINETWTSLESYGFKNSLMLRGNFTGSCTNPLVYGNSTYCTGNETTIFADSAYFKNFQWKKGGVDIANATNGSLYVPESGFYSVSASRGLCPSAVSPEFEVIESPGAIAGLTANKTSIECSTDIVTLEATGSTFFSWLRDGLVIENQTSTTYQTGIAGNYAVIVNAGQTCADTSDVVSVLQKEVPLLTITGPITVDLYAQDIIYSVGGRTGSTYSWLTMPDVIFMGDGSPTIKIDFGSTSGNIKVTETSAKGCKYSASIYVTVGEVTPLDKTKGQLLTAYPNPFSGSFTVTGADAEIKVFSATGEEIETIMYQDQTILGQNWKPGIYFIRILSGDTAKVLKVVKSE